MKLSFLKPPLFRTPFPCSRVSCVLLLQRSTHTSIKGRNDGHKVAVDPTVESSPFPSLRAPQHHISSTKDRLRQWKNHAALKFRNCADNFTASTKATFSQLGLELNKMTGYEAIEALKHAVVEQETQIHAARQAARDAKTAHDEAVAQRSSSQREVNDLLQRKSHWSDGDVGRFTTLVRQDHLFEQEEIRAKSKVDETENIVEREFSQLMRTILARYHEEQVWSDKIRSASTYGSLAALGLNMLVFILAILLVEPWKRRRLAQTFEKKIEALSSDNDNRMRANMSFVDGKIGDLEKLVVELTDGVSRSHGNLAKSRESEFNSITDWENSKSTLAAANRRYNNLELIVIGASAFVLGIGFSLCR